MTIECLNDHPAFDPHVDRELGCYVYALTGPEGIFYLGKGGGTGTGNDRVLHHLEDARKKLNSDPSTLSQKTRRIHAIWEMGEKVGWEIIRRKLPDMSTAFHLEAALIDLIGRDKLTNAQGGHKASELGRLTSRDVYRLSAPLVAPTRDCGKVLVFSIDKGLKSNGGNAYEATRGWWSATGRHEDATHAVGLVRGISFCVVEIDRWLNREDDVRERGLGSPPSGSTNWENEKLKRGFEGRSFTETGAHELLGKKFNKITEASGYWKRGGWLAVQFVGGEARILKGAKTKN